MGWSLAANSLLLRYGVQMMSPAAFRRLALALPETVERAHMDHPDFRVAGKIFATLGYPDNGCAMVKLNPAQQKELASSYPGVFAPVEGAWGRRGATTVHLKFATKSMIQSALLAAWRNTAPKPLLDQSLAAAKGATPAKTRGQTKSPAKPPKRR